MINFFKKVFQKNNKKKNNNNNDFLLEIYSEEIPSRLQGDLLNFTTQTTSNLINKFNKENDIKINCLVAIHRVIISLSNLKEEYKVIKEAKKGPKIGSNEEIIERFKQGNNLSSLEVLIEKDGYYYINEKVEILKLEEILKIFISNILHEISETFFKKQKEENGIKLQNSNITWTRPIRNILAILNNKAFEVEIGNLKTNNKTFLHKQIFNKKEIIVKNAKLEEFKNLLKKGQVIIDRNEKRQIILDKIKEFGYENLLYNSKIIEEIIGILDYPLVCKAKIDRKFLILPKELITLTLEINQKYIMLKNKNYNDIKMPESFKQVSEEFLVVIDGDRKNEKALENIISGYEKVASNRLNDAYFYYAGDLETPLFTLENNLKNIDFYKEISYFEFVEKMQALAEKYFKTSPFFEDLQNVIKYSKLDLGMKTVGEFPEMQGIMASIYFDKKVNKRISEKEIEIIKNQYNRIKKLEGESLVRNYEDFNIFWQFIAIERITSINILWQNEKPTGSGDRYAIKHKLLDLAFIMDNLGSIIPAQNLNEFKILINELNREAQEKLLELYLKELTSNTELRNRIMQFLLPHQNLFDIVIQYNYVEIKKWVDCLKIENFISAYKSLIGLNESLNLEFIEKWDYEEVFKYQVDFIRDLCFVSQGAPLNEKKLLNMCKNFENWKNDKDNIFKNEDKNSEKIKTLQFTFYTFNKFVPFELIKSL